MSSETIKTLNKLKELLSVSPIFEGLARPGKAINVGYERNWYGKQKPIGHLVVYDHDNFYSVMFQSARQNFFGQTFCMDEWGVDISKQNGTLFAQPDKGLSGAWEEIVGLEPVSSKHAQGFYNDIVALVNKAHNNRFDQGNKTMVLAA